MPERSAKTKSEWIGVLKQIIKSARDPQTGAQLYPCNFDHDFIDLPRIKDQKRPTVTAEQINHAIASADPQERLLHVVLAGTGLRISEALAVRVGRVSEKHSAFLEDQAIIQVRGSVYRGKEFPGRLKTDASKRDVDLVPALSAAISEFIREQKIESGGFLFQSEGGGVANLKRLTRQLKKRGIPGFHCFRRYRVTFLREAGVPEYIIKFWIGHASSDVTDLYTQARLEARKRWAEQAGLGFVGFDIAHQGRMVEEMQGHPVETPEAYHASDEDLPPIMLQPCEEDRLMSIIVGRPKEVTA
jgi:integrase